MKNQKKVFLQISFFVTSVILLFLFQNFISNQIDLPQPTSINYFGYYGSAMSGVGTGNYINEVKGFSNTIWIRGDTTSEVVDKLKSAQKQGLATILMVQNVFFPWNSSFIYSDYKTRFQDFYNAIRPYNYMISAYYVFDEPYWNNLQPNWKKNDPIKLQANLTDAITTIQQITQGKPTAIFFSYKEVTSNMLIPKNLNWLGFDCYVTDPNCTDSVITDYFNLIAKIKSPQQKLIIALDSFWGGPKSPTLTDEQKVIHRIRLWQKLIVSSNQIIALFPFLFQTDSHQELWGAQSMPNVLGWLQIYYSALKGDVICSVNDLVRLDPTGKISDRWVNAPMCLPQCENNDYVRRGATGHETDRWVNAYLCIGK